MKKIKGLVFGVIILVVLSCSTAFAAHYSCSGQAAGTEQTKHMVDGPPTVYCNFTGIYNETVYFADNGTKSFTGKHKHDSKSHTVSKCNGGWRCPWYV